MPAQLPNLNAVIFFDAGKEQFFMGVPVEIQNFGPVSHVSEEIVGIVFFLFFGDVPNVDVSAVSTGGEHAGIEGAPLNFDYAIFLSVECHQRSCQISHVPHRNILVGRATGE